MPDSFASPLHRQEFSSWLIPLVPLAVPEVHTRDESDEYDTVFVDPVELKELPPASTRVTLYHPGPGSMYHWQSDCPVYLHPLTGLSMLKPRQTTTRGQADVEGCRPCNVCGNSEDLTSITQSRKETRSELLWNPIHLRPRAG